MPRAEIDLLLRALSRGPVELVTVAATQGSAPREVGAWMAVTAPTPDTGGDGHAGGAGQGMDLSGTIGTIGGGRVEFEALALARERLALPGVPAPALVRHALGPSLGQCCGGVMHLRHERLGPGDAADIARRLRPGAAGVALFGGGHVGRAIVQALAPLPFDVTWIDSRDGIFPADVPAGVRCEHSDPVQAAVTDVPAGSHVLIMSFSHAEDLDIVAACLRRQRERGDLAFIGLIGSRSKWAAFRHRLEARGFSEAELAQVTCPIGLPGIAGKAPAVIAAAVAAQLLRLSGQGGR